MEKLKKACGILKYIFLIAVVVFVVSKIHTSPGKTTTITKTITKPGDSIPYPVKVAVPVPYKIVIHDTIPFLTRVDTAEILERYFTRYFYKDTIRDTLFIAIIQEIISQNRIIDRQLWVQNLRSQAITYVTNTISSASPKWFVGTSVSYNGRFGLGVGGLWCNKNHAIGINFDVINRSTTLTYQFALKPK